MNLICTLLLGSLALPAFAQEGTHTTAQEETAAKPSAASFSPEQLEQLVAPVALYPDSLLAQFLMATTYPLEIVEAARWRAKNPKLEGDALEKALQEFTWDPSVKSLCGFPDVLQRMNENLDWTRDLGDAFLGQREAVMTAVQTMRRKAFEAGSLKTTEEQKVTEQADKIIVIESADPEIIYVPTYYPTAVYGTWGYPSYYYPPLYPPPPAGGAWFGFSVGVIWGAAVWGDCDWGHSDVDIDIEHHNNFIDRTESGDRRQQVKDRAAAKPGTTNRGSWNHDPAHRRGVGYNDSRIAQQYGAASGERRVTRDQARGYGDRAASPSTGDRARPDTGTGRPDSGTGRDARLSGASPAQRPSGSTGSRPSSSDRAARPSTGTRSSSFTGSSGASFDRASSARGASSRGVSGSRGGGGRSGGSRGGGRGGRGRG